MKSEVRTFEAAGAAAASYILPARRQHQMPAAPELDLEVPS